METRGIATHEAMARILGVERSLVSKYVNGSRSCRDVTQLRQFAEAMGLSPEIFGLLGRPEGEVSRREVEDWKLVRQTLNRNRQVLTSVAARLYWEPLRIEGTNCLTTPAWIAPIPVPLNRVRLSLEEEAAEPLLDGREIETESVRPMVSDGSWYCERIACLPRVGPEKSGRRPLLCVVPVVNPRCRHRSRCAAERGHTGR